MSARWSCAALGVQEALFLSGLTCRKQGQIVVLDEPAANLEPTLQRRLLRRLRYQGQCLVITHHPELVPVEEAADLDRVGRVAPGPDGSCLLRSDLGQLSGREAHRWLRLLGPAHVRALLFAPAVIFCEGPTGVAALSQWWRQAQTTGLRDPEAANIPLVSLDGHTQFGAYVQYLDAFGIPWAIVADGPALRDGSPMARQLAGLNHQPGAVPRDRDDFVGWREAWQSTGVFTLARQFGTTAARPGSSRNTYDTSMRDRLRGSRQRPGGAPSC